MKKTSIFTMMIFTLAMMTTVLQAGNDEACCHVCGKKVCVLEVSKEKADVTCFSVKAKEICIPGIRFPWDKCGTRRCGGVRTVCVLEEVKKEKTVCKYDWSVKTICTSCCKRHGINHGGGCAKIQQDPRVPFEYYATDLAPEVAPLSSVKATVASEDSPVTTVSATKSARWERSRKLPIPVIINSANLAPLTK